MPKSNCIAIEYLHHQYFVQAQWTKHIRDYLLTLAEFNPSSRILEVGCGTGVILDEFSVSKCRFVAGIDLNPEAVYFAKSKLNSGHLSIANALQLPFPNGHFDITVSHYFLLWIHNQEQAIREMKRVTKPKGVIIAFAEPDYPSRIDYPNELGLIGKMQNSSLQLQGADIYAGRKIRELFTITGLKNVHSGVLGSLWKPEFQTNEFEFEWNYLKDDLSRFLPQNELDALMNLDLTTRKEGRRILYIPTFWAIGWV